MAKKKNINVDEIMSKQNDRIDSMIDSWNKDGIAFSRIDNEDSLFFKRLGISFDETGTTSQTGNDIVYYDLEIYDSGSNALRKIKRFDELEQKGGRLKSALMRDRKYVSQQEWEQEYLKHRTSKPNYYKMMAKGGRLKSALMRDRKYVSQEEWEQRYLENRKTNPKYYKENGGVIDDSWGTTEDFEVLYAMFPNNHSEAVEIWDRLSKKQKDAFIHDLDIQDAASEHISDSWLEFVNAKSYDDWLENATNWDEMKKGGRLKSALMRDRKYVSQEEWEQRYNKYRVSRPRYYKEDGGEIEAEHLYKVTLDGEEYWEFMNEVEMVDFVNGASFWDAVDNDVPEIATTEDAIAWLKANSYTVEPIMKDGGGISSSPKAFLESIDASKLTPKAKEFLQKQLLNDPDIETISEDDEYFQDVKRVLEEHFPNVAGENKSASTKKGASSKSKEIIALEQEISDLNELIEMEDDKKAIAKLKQEIEDLKELIELQ